MVTSVRPKNPPDVVDSGPVLPAELPRGTSRTADVRDNQGVSK